MGYILAALVIFLSGCASSPPVPSELRTASESTDCIKDQCLDFIYLHGTQRHSDEAREGFYEYVDPLHDWVMAELYQRPEVREGLLQGDQLRINPAPVKFYWGDMSTEALESAKASTAYSLSQ